MISPVLVESLQRKYIKVRFLRDFERDRSGVGGILLHSCDPTSIKKKKGKKRKERKILSGNTDLDLRDKSEYRGKFKAIFSPQKHILWPIIRTVPLRGFL